MLASLKSECELYKAEAKQLAQLFNGLNGDSQSASNTASDVTPLRLQTNQSEAPTKDSRIFSLKIRDHLEAVSDWMPNSTRANPGPHFISPSEKFFCGDIKPFSCPSKLVWLRVIDERLLERSRTHRPTSLDGIPFTLSCESVLRTGWCRPRAELANLWRACPSGTRDNFNPWQGSKQDRLDQWCTTFFGHGPLMDLWNPSWPKQVSRPKSCECLWELTNMMCTV